MGLDLGLERAGFKTVVALENDVSCIKTIRANRPSLPIIAKDIRTVTSKEILSTAHLKIGEPYLISGGPSCQAFSTAGRRKSLHDPRGMLIWEFMRIVRECKPKMFLMENVRGILSAAIKHRTIETRGKNNPPLEACEKPGSALELILSKFDKMGYRVTYWLLNSTDYGVPQKRWRVFIVGNRQGHAIDPPITTHSDIPITGKKRWLTLKDVIGDLNESSPSILKFSPSVGKYLHFIPQNGNWRDLPAHLQKLAMKKAYYAKGGRSGFFRRLSFSRPSPTLLTSPVTKASSLCHPSQLRPLSVTEYARIQQFPINWKFMGTIEQQYRQIGNAVPLGLASAVGKVIFNSLLEKK
jgi:DNA (cytosine-5)-methyltransferase 1